MKSLMCAHDGCDLCAGYVLGDEECSCSCGHAPPKPAPDPIFALGPAAERAAAEVAVIPA